ncbi:MAG TPA: hypothetical protein VK680_13645 [Solirubrobacteraceae bacterium]|jgi:hypothetical protein|nr:hypothetical protein [Solirubrobacteraceae bacterium]
MEQQPDYVDILACARLEREILQLLLAASDGWPLMPIEEVMDATADPVTALDAIASLCGSGLLRRKGESVMASCAAVHFAQIITRP